MMIPQILYSEFAIQIYSILSLFFITYFRILGKDYFWVIDDLEGIARFSEKWDDKNQKKIDSYELNGKHVKFLSFIKEIGFPATYSVSYVFILGRSIKSSGRTPKGMIFSDMSSLHGGIM